MSTGTAMKVYEDESEFDALNKSSETAIAMRENWDGEEFSELDLIRVKTPADGNLIWQVNSVSGIEHLEAIEGICVFKAYKGLIWPTLEQTKETKRPVVVSNDLRYGKLSIPREEVPPEMMEELDLREIEGQPGVYKWDELPYTQWGTGKNEVGKYAKEHMLLFILRKGECLPLFIQVGAGSLGDMRVFFKRMQNVPYYRAVLSLKLKEATSKGGVKYSKIVPKLIATLSPELGERVVAEYRDRLKDSHEKGMINLNEDDE